MKREGRQHSMVRTYPIFSAPRNTRPRPKSLGGFGSPPTAGPFTRVSTKPINQSKLTGKCGRPTCRECHISPASKSKVKAKGAQRLRLSSDIVSDYNLITWRVVDARSGVRLSGSSTMSVLNSLDREDDFMSYYEDNYEEYNSSEIEED